MCLHFSSFLIFFRKKENKLHEKYGHVLGTCKHCGKRRYLKGIKNKKWNKNYQKPLLEIDNAISENICIGCYYKNL